jgi:hypothetical protein
MPYSLRRVVVIVTACLTVAAAFVAYRAATTTSWSCGPTIHHQVQQGDYLTRIAHQYCEGDIPALVDALLLTYGADIYEGQIIWLPPTQDCYLVPTDAGTDFIIECPCQKW